MNIDNLQKRIILMSSIVPFVRIIMWVAIGWLSIEAKLHIGEYGLRCSIQLIWLGEINGAD